MACVRWAETEAWPAVLRGPMGGRDMGVAVGAWLWRSPLSVPSWCRPAKARGELMYVRMRARGGARSCVPTNPDPGQAA